MNDDAEKGWPVGCHGPSGWAEHRIVMRHIEIGTVLVNERGLAIYQHGKRPLSIVTIIGDVRSSPGTGDEHRPQQKECGQCPVYHGFSLT